MAPLIAMVLCCLVTALAASLAAERCRDEIKAILAQKSWQTANLSTVHSVQIEMWSQLRNMSWVEGNSGMSEALIERQIYHAVAGLSCIRRICEIGFNAGHSTIEWLLAAPHAEVVLFDLFSHKYSNLSERFIRQHPLLNATQRLELHKGDSTIVVPEYARSHKEQYCDLLSVDGGHTYDVAVRDIMNMRALANSEFHVLLIDDTNCRPGYCVDRAVNHMINQSVIERVANGSFTFGHRQSRGLSILRYLPAQH